MLEITSTGIKEIYPADFWWDRIFASLEKQREAEKQLAEKYDQPRRVIASVDIINKNKKLAGRIREAQIKGFTEQRTIFNPENPTKRVYFNVFGSVETHPARLYQEKKDDTFAKMYRSCGGANYYYDEQFTFKDFLIKDFPFILNPNHYNYIKGTRSYYAKATVDQMMRAKYLDQPFDPIDTVATLKWRADVHDSLHPVSFMMGRKFIGQKEGFLNSEVLLNQHLNPRIVRNFSRKLNIALRHQFYVLYREFVIETENQQIDSPRLLAQHFSENYKRKVKAMEPFALYVKYLKNKNPKISEKDIERFTEKALYDSKHKYDQIFNVNDDFIRNLLRKFNYDISRTREALRATSDYIVNECYTVGGRIENHSKVFVVDIDNYTNQHPDQALFKVCKVLGGNPYYAEKSWVNGGWHAYFIFNRQLSENDRDILSTALKNEKISVETDFSQKILRLPMSGSYLAFNVDYENKSYAVFHKSIAQYYHDNYIISKTIPHDRINQLASKIAANEKFKKKDEYTVLRFDLFDQDNSYNKKITGWQWEQYECGHRWERQSFEIPIMKHLFHMSYQQVAENIFSRKGTSKDLNAWTIDQWLANNDNKKYYETCELPERPAKDYLNESKTRTFDQFIGNEYLLPQQVANLIGDSFLQKAIQDKFIQADFDLYRFGKRMYKDPLNIKSTYAGILAHYGIHQVIGKFIFETTRRIKVNHNTFMRQFQSVQLPANIFSDIQKKIKSIIATNDIRSPYEQKIFQKLNILMKDLPTYQDRILYIDKYLTFDKYRIKNIIVKILNLQTIKVYNNRAHSINHAANYNINNISDICKLINFYLSFTNNSKLLKVQASESKTIAYDQVNQQFIIAKISDDLHQIFRPVWSINNSVPIDINRKFNNLIFADFNSLKVQTFDKTNFNFDNQQIKVQIDNCRELKTIRESLESTGPPSSKHLYI